ncbi:MAG: hypothetical protein ACHQIM_17935 [Sphingobacteriales bacterium]
MNRKLIVELIAALKSLILKQDKKLVPVKVYAVNNSKRFPARLK